jgi:hypothetical protein
MPKTGRRFVAEFIVLISLALIAGTGFVVAQDATTHKIELGQTVSGTLDAKTFAQTYTFDAKNGDSVTLTATSQTQGLFLAVLLSGPDGNVLSQNADLTKAAVSLSNITIAADGTYTVTVLRATGAQGAAKGTFTLALTGGSTQPAATQAATASTSAATVTLSQGMSVALSWGTTDDLNLEVRDPIGGDVSHNSISTASGGRLTNDVNANCATATADNPTENISWPAGNVPSGSYEIIVYHNQTCSSAASGATSAATASEATTAPTGTEVSFAISVTINGDTREPIRGALASGQQYVASFLLTSADQVTIYPGGVLALDLAPFAAKISAPKTLNFNTAVTGTIDHNNAADAGSFQVTQANTPVTITMNATSGSLDTFLVLVGANGQVITSNDDANNNTRNSQIVNQTLAAGRYTVIATRFALQNGGTEGNYALNVSNGRTTTNNTTVIPTVAPLNNGTTSSGTSASLPAGNITVALSWNTRADLRLLIRDPNGVSVFSDNTTPDNSGILDRLGNFKCQNVTSSPLTYAYWPTNQTLTPGTYEVGVWQQSRCTDQNLQPQYTLVVSVLGKEIIRRTDRPDPRGLHLLTTFTVDAAGNATAGAAGIVQEQFTEDISAQLNNNPQTLSFGTAVNGTIDANNPFVIYTFTAKTTDRVAIALRNTAGNLDPNLFLIDSSGKKVIASNDDQEPGKISDSRIEIPNANLKQFPADGTYVIVVTRYGVKLGGTTGNYELTIAQLNQ